MILISTQKLFKIKYRSADDIIKLIYIVRTIVLDIRIIF